VNLECTESVAAPVLDSAFAVAFLGLAAVALAKGDLGCCSGPGCFGGCPTALLVTGLGGGALFGASAVYGFTTTSRCRDIVRHARSTAVTPGDPCSIIVRSQLKDESVFSATPLVDCTLLSVHR
jgi:hypothetical protein